MKALITDAQKTSCTLLLPVRDSKDISGIKSGDIDADADLLSDAHELANWISSLPNENEKASIYRASLHCFTSNGAL